MQKLIFISLLFFFVSLQDVIAYVGPGMGGGLIAAIIGIIIAFLAALFGLIYFPLKRFFKNLKKKEKDKKNQEQ